MRILLTNDDGIHSPGLWAVAEALKGVGEVTVVAPDRDQSGIGTAMTILAVVRAQEITSPIDGVKAFSVEGTPADCVILATAELVKQPFDLLVSGINPGSNMGMDVVVSGTVGGAIQGYLRGIPSLAVSVASITDVQFEAAAQTAKALAEGISNNSMPASLLLNVNLPNVGADKIERVEITGLGPGTYLAGVERVHDGRRTLYWIRHNKPVNAPIEEGTDIWAVRNNRVSITPLNLPFGLGKPSLSFDALGDVLAREVALELGLKRS